MKPKDDTRQRLSELTNAVTAPSMERIKNQPRQSTENTDNGDIRAAPTSSHTLFVIPRVRGDGFQASIRGHILDLADPSSGHALAPTPDDLFVVSIAAEVAWSARRALRAQGLPHDVSVSATWSASEAPPGLASIHLTVAVSGCPEAASAVLAGAFESRLARRSLGQHVVQISLEGVKR
jgi:uncharacterized OsmC-like protein